MKKTLILSILIGFMLLGATALADENWLAEDPARVAAVILHTNDVHVAFQDNTGYDGLALYKKSLKRSTIMCCLSTRETPYRARRSGPFPRALKSSK